MADAHGGRADEDRTAALEFLLEPGPWRSGALGVVLDAVSWAMTEDTSAVLSIADPATGRRWVSAIAQFMPGPVGAPRVRLLDQVESNTDLAARGVHLAIVPAAGAAALVDSESVVILTEDDPDMLGELDSEPHHTARGAPVPVTEWSVMAQTVLFDLAGAESLLARRDEISASVAGGPVHPMWPLALAIASDPGSQDAWAEAMRVIRAHSPAALLGNPELLAISASAMEEQEGIAVAYNWRAELEQLAPLIAAPVFEPEPAPEVVREPAPEPTSKPAPAPPVPEPEAAPPGPPIRLARGEVTDLPLGAHRWTVTISCPQAVGMAALEVDVVAFALTDQHKVRADRDMVFYNAPEMADGSIRLLKHSQMSQSVEIDLSRVSEGHSRIAVAALIDGPYAFGELGPIELSIVSPEGTVVHSRFEEARAERAMIATEIYRRSDYWRARAVWQGYLNGLAGLATEFGVRVQQ